jgi:hypothetical protein
MNTSTQIYQTRVRDNLILISLKSMSYKFKIRI